MDVGACRIAGEPLAFAVGQRGFAVKRGGEFEGDKWPPRGDAAEKSPVEPLGFFFADAFGDGDACRLQAGNALPGNERVRVAAGDDGTGDARGNQRVGAGRGASLVRAGLKGDVGGGAACFLARFSQRVGFGVRFARADVPAFADGFVAFDEDAADARVRRGGEDAALCQFKRALHPAGILFGVGGGHGWWFPAGLGFMRQGRASLTLHLRKRDLYSNTHKVLYKARR